MNDSREATDEGRLHSRCPEHVSSSQVGDVVCDLHVTTWHALRTKQCPINILPWPNLVPSHTCNSQACLS